MRKTSWGTRDEIQFLDNLGQASDKTAVFSSIVMLENYLESAYKRCEWGDIDYKEVIAYAKKLLIEAHNVWSRCP